MADRPISDLPVATTATGTDFLIINKDNSETKRISYDDLTSATGFNPLYVFSDVSFRGSDVLPVGSQYVAPGRLATDKETVGTNDIITSVIKTAAGVTNLLAETKASFTLPAGADSAVIVFRAAAGALSGTDATDAATVAKYGRGRIKYSTLIDNQGGTFDNGQANSSAAVGFNMTWPGSAVLGRRYDVKSADKINSFKATSKGATISFTTKIFVQDTKILYYFLGPGTFAVFPFDSTNATAAAAAAAVVAQNNDIVEDAPPEPAEYVSAMVQEQLKNQISQSIDAINITLIAGTQQNGNAWTSNQENALKDAMKELYRMRYDFSGTTEQHEVELARIIKDLIADVPDFAFSYNVSDILSVPATLF